MQLKRGSETGGGGLLAAEMTGFAEMQFCGCLHGAASCASLQGLSFFVDE
jgi:hypothetical protein